ncbi:MAG: fumarate hydratase [Gammaproteobacteria bacterium]|nr:fumarate hydratase [Gammaproteobacteria bacterium]
MTIIQQNDFIQSIADALQFISYYHSIDFIQAMGHAYKNEQSESAKDAIAQILYNSRLCAEGRRPICQDTGIAVVFVEVGMEVQWHDGGGASTLGLDDMINIGVRRAYTLPENKLRASVLIDPAGQRQNTKDNTPAIIHYKVVPGDKVSVKIAAKGGGSENKAKFATLLPSDNIADWVVNQVKSMGAGWCPPGILGIGIGGTPEKSMLLAKESLLSPVTMPDLLLKEKDNQEISGIEKLRVDIYRKVNALGIGAQGLGGMTTVLDVNILDYPTHAASLPVSVIPNCVATRHTHFVLDGTGPAEFIPPALSDWPNITWQANDLSKSINLDQLSKEEIQSWKPGDRLLLNGKILTARDAAHKKISSFLENGQALPDGLSFENKFVYYVGPVDPINDEIVGPAGPTTATRMDKYTKMMLEKSGIAGMIGKAERGDDTIGLIKAHQSVYLIAVGGAAFLISKSIKEAKVVAFEELGMEAVYEFTVKDMPVTVAVDSEGESIHKTGPALWQNMSMAKSTN